MALVGSDFHGDPNRLYEFLNYRPEEKHIVGGDVFDDDTADPEGALECYDMILHGNARNPELVDFVFGNHEVHYMYYAPFSCSGYVESDVVKSKLNRTKHRFGVALVEDNFLITHAGVHPRLAKFPDVHEECAWLNQQWQDFINFTPQPYQTKYPKNPIFNVGKIRTGPDSYGGIFWLQWVGNDEHKGESLSAQYNQIVGHNTLDKIYIMNHQGKTIVSVDSIRNDCFNTKTGKVETYGFNR